MAIEAHDEETAIEETAPPGRGRRRFAYFLIVVLAILLLAFIPPLVNVSHFQRRVDAEISAALGRPVHFDRLSLNLLPVPGFTLENFVIEEDPAFGYEPTIHADEVRINLRLASLWRRRFEFSTISFTDPSVNIVHTADGRWNIQGLLLQASRIPAAPTAQTHAGPAPRFPYIEATGARVNLKLGQEKIPVALTEADFALWQPMEHQWRLRLEATPSRTDIAPGESGALRVEGMLGGDGDTPGLGGMPIDLRATLEDAQLGGLTSLLLGRDVGLRGDVAATVAMQGTIGRNNMTATLNIENARRADFIPPHPIALSADCRAVAGNAFHAFTSVLCRLPASHSSSPAMVAVAAEVPDVREPQLASIRVDVPSLPSQTLYDWLAVATPHPPTAFTGRGTLTGALEWGTAPLVSTKAIQSGLPLSNATWTGELKLTGEWLQPDAAGADGAPLGDVVLSSTPSIAQGDGRAKITKLPPVHDSFDLAPVSLPLGGERPATLTGQVDDSGYSLHLAGGVAVDQLLALGDAVPQFGDGLHKLLAREDASGPQDQNVTKPRPNGARGSRPANSSTPGPSKTASAAPVAIDLSVSRAWGGPQVWTQSAPPAVSAHAANKSRR